METFEVLRGLVKKVSAEGGLASLAGEFFENVSDTGDNSFTGSHGIMSSIEGRYNNLGKLVIDVVNEKPDFDDPDAMESAMDARKRWSMFLDAATGYNSKKRGDKAKENAKKASKAKSAVSQTRHLISMTSPDASLVEQAESLIAEIETALEAGDNARAAGRGDKLTKLFE